MNSAKPEPCPNCDTHHKVTDPCCFMYREWPVDEEEPPMNIDDSLDNKNTSGDSISLRQT